MKNLNLIKELQHQSTWKLIFLTFITFGTYLAHNIARQSKVINSVLDDKEKISKLFIMIFFIFSYVNLIGFIDRNVIRIPFYYFDSSFFKYIYLVFFQIVYIADFVIFIMLVCWAIKVRRKVNAYCELNKGDLSRFNIFWSIVFTPYYFNYNVNCIMEEESAEPEAINL